MAKNLVYRNADAQNRVEVLATTFAPGKQTLSLAGEAVVTVTGSGDYTRSDTTSFAPATISGIPAGGAGLVGKEVTLAFDGTWEFPQADFTGITTASPQGTLVNIINATNLFTNAAVSGSITAYGYVDFPVDYDKTRGMIPVRIGTR